jgi:hypothetical protein
MTAKCTNCGRTEYEITADAKILDLLEEFQSGVYTCCQVSEWAHEQWLAWAEARQEDSQRLDDATGWSEFDGSEVVFVPVRLRLQRTPWYRNSDDLG